MNCHLWKASHNFYLLPIKQALSFSFFPSITLAEVLLNPNSNLSALVKKSVFSMYGFCPFNNKSMQQIESYHPPNHYDRGGTHLYSALYNRGGRPLHFVTMVTILISGHHWMSLLFVNWHQFFARIWPMRWRQPSREALIQSWEMARNLPNSTKDTILK